MDAVPAEENARAARAFNAILAADTRLESIIIPVLGKKSTGCRSQSLNKAFQRFQGSNGSKGVVLSDFQSVPEPLVLRQNDALGTVGT